MRFSIKELMWSVTFASLALECLVLSIPPKNVPEVALNYAGVAFFGAALGSLFRKTALGFVFGLFVALIFALMLAAAI